MKLTKFILAIIINVFILWASSQLINGFIVSQNFSDILFLAFILTVFNLIFQPILKIIFSPIIILTLGIGILIVNGLILYLLDFLFISITIQSIKDLFYATLIFSVFNFIFYKATQPK